MRLRTIIPGLGVYSSEELEEVPVNVCFPETELPRKPPQTLRSGSREQTQENDHVRRSICSDMLVSTFLLAADVHH